MTAIHRERADEWYHPKALEMMMYFFYIISKLYDNDGAR